MGLGKAWEGEAGLHVQASSIEAHLVIRNPQELPQMLLQTSLFCWLHSFDKPLIC